MKKSRRRIRLGSADDEHYRQLQLHQGEAGSDIYEAKKALSRGSCREAFAPFVRATRQIGKAEAHLESLGSKNWSVGFEPGEAKIHVMNQSALKEDEKTLTSSLQRCLRR